MEYQEVKRSWQTTNNKGNGLEEQRDSWDIRNKLDGNGSFRTCTSHTVLFAGKEEGYSHGVAVVLNKDSTQSLLGYAPVSDRILKIRLQIKPLNISIIQFYAPTTAASEEEIEEFYNVLQEEIDNIQSRDINIVMGDADCKVGKFNITTENSGRYGLGECNERGEILIDFRKAETRKQDNGI